VSCFVVGLGMGLVVAPTVVAAQSSVGWAERGVVTGTNMFCRSLGSAIGVAVFGAVANAALRGRSPEDTHDTGALVTATHHVFVGVVIVVAAMLVAVIAMPGHHDSRERDEASLPADRTSERAA
jgi:MFS family permease